MAGLALMLLAIPPPSPASSLSAPNFRDRFVTAPKSMLRQATPVVATDATSQALADLGLTPPISASNVFGKNAQPNDGDTEWCTGIKLNTKMEPAAMKTPKPASDSNQHVHHNCTITPEEIRFVIDRAGTQIRECYRLRPAHNSANSSAVEGKAVARFVIESTGSVRGAVLEVLVGPGSGDATSCMQKIVAQLQFPMSHGRTCVTYPFEFSD